VDPQSMGFNDYLPKPFSPQKLSQILDQYIPQRRNVAPR
jgi:CheY-like chemotaxis protein